MTLKALLPLFAFLCLVVHHAGGAPHVSRAAQAQHAPHFSSHVSFATPAHSFSHGVGAEHPQPLHSHTLHGNFRQNLPRLRLNGYRSLQGLPDVTTTHFRDGAVFQGYPRGRPAINFQQYPLPQENGLSHQNQLAFGGNSLGHVEPGNYHIPLLPPSPYKVDSPDAESLWPEGLFIPPGTPLRLGPQKPHNNNFLGYPDQGQNKIYDPYLLNDAEALRALAHIKEHGELFHHEIPHIRALLANQNIRLANNLQPNRLGSIRPTSPWNRY